MTKQNAIDAMLEGKKVTHRYFNSHEWVTIQNGRILTEDGYTASIQEFFSFRTEESWQIDWDLFQVN